MDRFEFEDLISAYIENDLPINKRKEVEAYLDNNPSYNHLVKQISYNMDALKKLPKITSKNNFNQKLMEKINFNKTNTNPAVTKNANFFGFTFLNAFFLFGLVILLFVLSFEITGLKPSGKNSRPYQFTDNKKFLGKNGVINDNKKNDTSIKNLTTFQNDTTKKEKMDLSRNIKYVND